MTRTKLRVCSAPGCPVLHAGTGRCPSCQREADKERGTPTERGYGPEHRALRKQWESKVAAGGVRCWRCGGLINAGTPWDLGHADEDRSVYRGPEHVRCNRATASRTGDRNR